MSQFENVPQISTKRMLLSGGFHVENEEELALSIKRYEGTLTPQNGVSQRLSSIHLTLSPKSSVHEPLPFFSNNNLTTQQNVFYGPCQRRRGENFVTRAQAYRPSLVHPTRANRPDFSNRNLVQSSSLYPSNICNRSLASRVDNNLFNQTRPFINQLEKPIHEIIMVYDSDEEEEIG
ncbi:hypothetical protein HAX54_000041, partial [Datura stramonium]|nr:hypothetical protein [Datura stramonium]